MKYIKKRAVKLLLAAFALISAFGAAMTVSAAAPKLSAKKVTCYTRNCTYLTLKGVKTKDYEKVSVMIDVKDPKIASAYYERGEKKNSNCRIQVWGNAKGKTTATLTVKYGKKQKQKLKFSIQVKEAGSICTSFKLGNKNYTNKLNKGNTDIWDKKLKGKLKLSIKTKSDWKIDRIFLITNNYATKDIKNNTIVNLSKCKMIEIHFQNKKTKGMVAAAVIWGNDPMI